MHVPGYGATPHTDAACRKLRACEAGASDRPQGSGGRAARPSLVGGCAPVVTDLMLQASYPARDVAHLLGPAPDEMLLTCLAVAPGVEGVVLVSVAVELKEGMGAGACVFQSRDLSAVRRFAFRDCPAKRACVQAATPNQRSDLDALRGAE